VRPAAAAGRHAAANRATSADTGAVGAGAGATVSKWLGAEKAEPGGLGIATVQRDEMAVSAIVALNAAGSPPPGAHRTFEQVADGSFQHWKDRSRPFTNTTLGAVITNAALSKTDCFWVAQGGHDGLGRRQDRPHLGRGDGAAGLCALFCPRGRLGRRRHNRDCHAEPRALRGILDVVAGRQHYRTDSRLKAHHQRDGR